MIFLDTSSWIALRMRSDTHHGVATTLLRAHADQPMLTTSHVRGETWAYVRRRSGQAAAVGFLDDLARSPRASPSGR